MYNSINDKTKTNKPKKLNKKRVFFVLFIFILLITSYSWDRESPPDADSHSETIENYSDAKNSDNTSSTDVPEDTNVAENTNFTPAYLTDAQVNSVLTIYKTSPAKTVYLTFDDGPSNSVTPLILDVLKERNIKATFFVLGVYVDMYPSIVQREYSEGHYIANHGYSHKYSEIYVSPDTILNDYTQCNTSLQKALNNKSYSSNIYRFPGGSSGRTI